MARSRGPAASRGLLLALAALASLAFGASATYAQVAAPASLTVVASPAMATAGASVTVTVTAASALSTAPTATVSGTCIAAGPITLGPAASATSYTGTYTVPAGIGDCVTSVAVSGTDLSGSAVTGSASFTLDRTPPAAPTATLSGGTLGTSGWYTAAPIIALASTDATSGVAATYYQFVAHLAAPPANALPGTWTTFIAGFSPSDGDSDLYAFSVDHAGNAASPVNLGEFKVDTVAPKLTTTASRTLAAAGASVGLTVTASEPLVAAPSVTVSGPCITSSPVALTATTPTTYTGTYSVPVGSTDCAASVTASGADLAGNASSGGSASFNIDRTPPTLTTTASVTSASMGTSVALSVTASEPLGAAPTASVSGTCITATPVALAAAATANTYTGTYAVPIGTTDCTASVTTSAADLAGNASTGGSASFNVARSAQAQKIDPALLQQMAAQPATSLPLIVEMNPVATPFPLQPNVQLAQQALGLLQQFGTPVADLSLIDAAAGWAPANGIEAIALNAGVAFIHEDSTVTPRVVSTTAVVSSTALTSAYPRAVHADSVWAQGGSGAGVTVAVLDSGIAPDADLTQPTSRIVASVNFADPLPVGVQDPGGHGTHVAGIIAGNGTHSGGQFIGVAPSANLVDVRVLDSNGNGRVSSVIRGIEWVLAHKAQYQIRVINLSLGAPARLPYRADPLAAAVEIAWNRGLVVVAAAGNNGTTTGAVDRPGNDPYVVTVGATDDLGTPQVTDDTLAAFSSHGTPQGSTAKPDVVAPGRGIVSIRVPGSALDTLNPSRVVTATNGTTYFALSGTSQSTALVSGTVALLLEHQPTLTPDQVKAILTGTAQTYGTPATPGLLDAYAATNSAPLGYADQGLVPADAFSRTIYPILYGQPVMSSDPRYQGIIWDSTVWQGIIWDGIIWDGIIWDGIIWDSLSWSSLPWDTTAWDSTAWNRPGWDTPAWGTLPPS